LKNLKHTSKELLVRGFKKSNRQTYKGYLYQRISESKMSYLKVEVVQTSCVFVLQIEEPIDTLRRLTLFFQDNFVQLNDFNLHRYQDGTAMVIVNAVVEKIRIEAIVSLLHLLPGVLKAQRVEGR
jgi:hypothetical protein